MSMGLRIAKKLYKQQNSYLGYGSYSVVFSAGNSQIIKIGLSTVDGYLDYLELICANQDNPWYPKIYSTYIDYEKDFYIVKMEKLKSIFSCSELTKECNNLLTKIEHNEKTNIEYLDKAIEQIKGLAPYINYNTLHKQEEDLFDYHDGMLVWDLQNFNFMVRDFYSDNQQLVIIDPFNINTVFVPEDWETYLDKYIGD